MDALQADRLRGRLLALLIGLEDRLTAKDATLIHEFIDAGEFGLSLEQVVDVLAETHREMTDRERAEMLALVADMAMDDRVPRAMELCPRVT